ncbi:hypothetical protein, partial [Candidatus Frankia alpina]|uniref:hypothetical protein n=1 Tax=Candidatus Frankia alpina TaxID=2699483 RepID=UPI001A99A5CE
TRDLEVFPKLAMADSNQIAGIINLKPATIFPPSRIRKFGRKCLPRGIRENSTASSRRAEDPGLSPA